MASLDQLRAEWEQLRQARAQGIKRISHNGRDVVYQDDEAMARAMRDLERQIEAASAPGGRGPIRVTTSKGI